MTTATGKGHFYKAIIHPAEEGGYWAEVPSLHGCFTQASTLDEIKTLLEEAIHFHLECFGAEGEIPPAKETLKKGS